MLTSPTTLLEMLQQAYQQKPNLTVNLNLAPFAIPTTLLLVPP